MSFINDLCSMFGSLSLSQGKTGACTMIPNSMTNPPVCRCAAARSSPDPRHRATAMQFRGGLDGYPPRMAEEVEHEAERLSRARAPWSRTSERATRWAGTGWAVAVVALATAAWMVAGFAMDFDR